MKGAYHIALKSVYKEVVGSELEYENMGKPHKITYDYVKSLLCVDRIFCIGDNQLSDILGIILSFQLIWLFFFKNLGANNAGLDSVLVKTGLYSGNEKLIVHPKYVFNDVYEAVLNFMSKT